MTDAITILDEFYNLCTAVRFRYDQYRSLFEDDPHGLALCKNVTPFFFYDVSRAFVDTILLDFCKITDPAGAGNKTNLTTNYILDVLPWPNGIRERLREYNDRLMTFRMKIEPARSKRIAHIDLTAQTERLDSMGKFEIGEDTQFLLDLQTFFDIAYSHLHSGTYKPIAAGGGIDTYKVVRAIEKAILFDECNRCTEKDRNSDLLDFEERK